MFLVFKAILSDEEILHLQKCVWFFGEWYHWFCFFEDVNKRAVTLTVEHHQEVIDHFFGRNV